MTVNEFQNSTTPTPIITTICNPKQPDSKMAKQGTKQPQSVISGYLDRGRYVMHDSRIKMSFVVFVLQILLCRSNGAPHAGALVPFTYAGAEHKQTFLAPSRIFEFSNLKRRRVKIKQEYKANGAGLGSAVWDGSFVLSEYMQREVDVNKKCIVEVGCGLGLVSVVLGMSGEENFIIATDGDSKLFPLLKKNFEHNLGTKKVNEKIAIQKLKWGNFSEMDLVIDKCKEKNGIDLIVAADVVFEHDPEKKNVTDGLHLANATFRLLHDTLEYLSVRTNKIHGKVPKIYLAYKQRYSREGSFFALAKKSFHASIVPRRKIHRDFIKAKIKIFEFVLKTKISNPVSEEKRTDL